MKWLPPEDLGCSPAEGRGWMAALLRIQQPHPGGCASSLSSWRCSEEQEPCSWESPDCSECSPSRFLPHRPWQWPFATEFPDQANPGCFPSCQGKHKGHCSHLQPGSPPAPEPSLPWLTRGLVRTRDQSLRDWGFAESCISHRTGLSVVTVTGMWPKSQGRRLIPHPH